MCERYKQCVDCKQQHEHQHQPDHQQLGSGSLALESRYGLVLAPGTIWARGGEAAGTAPAAH